MRHEDTRIYKTSIELVTACTRVIERMPPGFGWYADQLRRAAASVTLNFCEGCRRIGVRERRNFFTIAAASASEVSGAIDVAFAMKTAREEDRAEVKRLTNHISAMLRLFR